MSNSSSVNKLRRKESKCKSQDEYNEMLKNKFIAKNQRSDQSITTRLSK